MISNPESRNGVYMSGQGALHLQFTYPTLTAQQYELLAKAKKFCSEETARVIHSNKPPQLPIISQSPPQNKNLQRQQAIQFMSRVYVGSISFEVREDMLKAAFSNYGLVKSVNMSWDMSTMKHKGFAFIEFEHPEAAGLAINKMNGIKMGNRQLKVGRPSNMPQTASILEEIDKECENGSCIYVANIHPEFDKDDVISLMTPFGPIEGCQMQPNTDDLLRKSYAYLQFKDRADANEALTADKLDLAGYSLNICKAITPIKEPINTNVNNASNDTTENTNKKSKINNNNNNINNNMNNISENNDDNNSRGHNNYNNKNHDDNLGSNNINMG